MIDDNKGKERVLYEIFSIIGVENPQGRQSLKDDTNRGDFVICPLP